MKPLLKYDPLLYGSRSTVTVVPNATLSSKALTAGLAGNMMARLRMGGAVFRITRWAAVGLLKGSRGARIFGSIREGELMCVRNEGFAHRAW